MAPMPDPADTAHGGRAQDTIDEPAPSHFESLITTLRDRYNRGSDACRRRIEQELAAVIKSRP